MDEISQHEENAENTSTIKHEYNNLKIYTLKSEDVLKFLIPVYRNNLTAVLKLIILLPQKDQSQSKI